MKLRQAKRHRLLYKQRIQLSNNNYAYVERRTGVLEVVGQRLLVEDAADGERAEIERVEAMPRDVDDAEILVEGALELGLAQTRARRPVSLDTEANINVRNTLVT